MTFPATTVTDTTPKASAPKAMGNDPNPAKAGWGTRVFLTALCVLWMVPIIGTLVTSFRPLDDCAGCAGCCPSSGGRSNRFSSS